jgi:hypothetical protein
MIRRLINKVVRLPIAHGYVIIGLVCMLDQSFALAASHGASSPSIVTDFVDFWAASRLLLNGGNPFSPTEVLELQRSVGLVNPSRFDVESTVDAFIRSTVRRYGLQVSRFSGCCCTFSSYCYQHVLWAIYSHVERKSYLPWIAVLTFIPAWFVLIIGQLSHLFC